MKVNLPNDVQKLLKQLHEAGYEAYIVGGCVRDSLLGREPSDWDICTNATPDQMEDVFLNNITCPTGLKHGTITVFMNNQGYEITTYRLDGEYSDGRRPDNVEFTSSLVEDLKRRDFYVNAMAYNEEEGLIDPFNGAEYLLYKNIECVGNPHERIKEDGLRMLRAVRFATQLDFTIEIETCDAIYENRAMLKDISKERVREEFNKILLSEKPSRGIDLLRSLRLLELILPELMNCIGFDQCNKHHHKSVYNHIMAVVDNTEVNLQLRLSALFHDIGKPETFTLDENGEGHFYGHHKESAKICREIMTRLKYSNKEIEHVSELVYYHMTRYENLRTPLVKRFINKIGIDRLDDLFKLFIADRVGSRPPYIFDDIYELKFACEKILSEKQPLTIRDLDISGFDLMEIGVPQGEEMGTILKQLLEIVLGSPESNRKDVLIQIVQNELDLKEVNYGIHN